MPATVRWLGLALLGILIAAGVSIAASRLASQQIGLASEPISAGDALAPKLQAKGGSHRPSQTQPGKRRTTVSPTPSPPVKTPQPQPTAPSSPETAPAPPVQSNGSGTPAGGDGEHGGGGGGGADD
jgi:hypothetical protein